MHSTKFLYGIDPKELKGMEYEEALRYKYDMGTKLYGQLFKTHGRTKFETEKLQARMIYVAKANEFTKKLLEELE
jgi:hypothetical protein